MIRRLPLGGLYVVSLALIVTLTGCGGSSSGSSASSSHDSGGSSGSTSSGSGSSGSSSPSFTVSSVAPASGSTNVALNATIQLTLSAGAAFSSANPANVQVSGTQPIAGAVTYDDSNNTVTFTPSALLASNTSYTVKVSGVTSSTGATLTAFTSSFTTGTTQSAPNGTYVVEYQAALFPSGSSFNGTGELFIETCGCVTIQLEGAAATTTYTVLFCPAYPAGSNNPSSSNCFSAGSIETDANGDADQDVSFPQPGNWAGDFELEAGSTVQYSTNLVSPTAAGGSTQVYMATLEPLSTVNGGALQKATTSDPQGPITAGTVTWFNGGLQFSLTGGSAKTSYTATENIVALGSSSSYELVNSQSQSSFASDSNGNLDFSVLQDGSEGDIFELEPTSSQIGYIGGFTIPD